MLIAWNPVLRKEVWRVPQKADWNGGILATAADIIFQGTAQGDFIAYDAATGKELWKINLGGGIIAPPVTYLLDGKQYISIVAGWGGGYGMKKKFAPLQQGRIFTFVLNGNASMPTFVTQENKTKPEVSISASSEELKHGETLFWQYCGTCHVVNEGGGGLAPDLSYSFIAVNQESFLSVTHHGALLSEGMPVFSKKLTEQELLAIRKFIFTKAKNK